MEQLELDAVGVPEHEDRCPRDRVGGRDRRARHPGRGEAVRPLLERFDAGDGEREVVEPDARLVEGAGVPGPVLRQAQPGAAGGDEAAFVLGQGLIGVVTSIIGMIVSGIIVLGAQKMKNLESRGLAMASAILAALPCISPCCIVGLPIGIWAITAMNDPQVKAVYQ